MLKDSLLELGLNKTEISVYLNIVERGKVSPTEISHKTGIKRTTVYAVTEELVKKRLIEEDITGKTKHFIPRSISSLKNYTKDARRDLDIKDKIIEEILPDLADLSDTANYSIPKIRFIGPDDVEDFYKEQAPRWIESMKETNETTWWGYQGDDYFKLKVNTDFIDWYWSICPEELDLKIFTEKREGEAKMLKERIYPRRLTKPWQGEPFSAGLWVIGDYVINIITQNDGQYLVQIEDSLLASSQRTLFKKLWTDSD